MQGGVSNMAKQEAPEPSFPTKTPTQQQYRDQSSL